MKWRMENIGIGFLLALSACACNHNSYTVIQREEADDYWVRIVLKHDGHKYFAECNNYKAPGKPGIDPDKITHCNLHVGDEVKCQFFPDRASGYDLICGDELTDGKLDTTGGNELLLIKKEEQ
jgi:hypothetical protein